MIRHCTATPRRSTAASEGMLSGGSLQAMPVRDEKLAAHEIDPGHDLGDRVLHLATSRFFIDAPTDLKNAFQN